MKRYRFIKRNKIEKVVAKVVFVLLILTVIGTSIWAVIKNSKPRYIYVFEPTASSEENNQSETISQEEVSLANLESVKAQMGNAEEIEEAFSEKVSELPAKSMQEECKTDLKVNEKEKNSSEEKYVLTEENLFLMNQIVFAEAGELSPEVQKGVTWVILNRIESEEHPNSVKEVIFEKNQFSPTEGDEIFFWDWPDNETCYYREVEEEDITDEVKTSVMLALNGDNPIGDMVGFYSLQWISEKELALREKWGFYSPNWPKDENGNVIDGVYYNPVDSEIINGMTLYRKVIVIDGTVFHGEW